MIESNKLNTSFNNFKIDIEQTNTIRLLEYSNHEILSLKNIKTSLILIEEIDIIESFKITNRKVSSITIEEIITT